MADAELIAGSFTVEEREGAVMREWTDEGAARNRPLEVSRGTVVDEMNSCHGRDIRPARDLRKPVRDQKNCVVSPVRFHSQDR